MWYQSELLLRDRQQRVERLAEESRMHRLAAGRAHEPARPRRLHFLSRR